MEAEETGVPLGEGFHFAVLGAHDADVNHLFAHLRRHAEEDIGRQYLETHRYRAGWRLRGEEAAGRLVWGDEHEAGGPYDVVIDGREFLGYFMIRKVMAGEELMRAAGTVTKKLAKWLGERGYLDPDAVEIAAERGGEAARDLPKAERLSRLLFDHARKTTIDANALADDDYVEDYLMIDKVEPGKLWFEGGIGPVAVPKAASTIAQPGWSVNIVLGRRGQTWHILEVGNVYP